MTRRGWFGNSHGHALAAKGIKLYASKQPLQDPVFFAHRDSPISFANVQRMLDDGMTYDMMVRATPDADHVELRRQAIRAIDGRSGAPTMSQIDSMGVDSLTKVAKVNPTIRARCAKILQDEQKASFIPEPKRSLLKKNLESKA